MSTQKNMARTTAFALLLIAAIFIFPASSEANGPMAGCQCTDFVYGQRPDIPNSMGRAKDFLYSSRIHRFPYDQVPQVGDVAVFLRGEFGFSALYGHVALVIDVNEAMDRFSIVGWDGLKADCKLEISLDLPVTYNTYFIHHKEPVRFQTLSLEGWSALANEQISRRFEDSDACNLLEIENILPGSVCPNGSRCCDETDNLAENNRSQGVPNSFLERFNQLKFGRQ
jgi:hypothetical protein